MLDPWNFKSLFLAFRLQAGITPAIPWNSRRRRVPELSTEKKPCERGRRVVETRAAGSRSELLPLLGPRAAGRAHPGGGGRSPLPDRIRDQRLRMRVLFALRRAGPDYALRPTELFRSLLVTSGAITKQVDRLAALGYVDRLPGPPKSGGFLIWLTAKGKRTADQAMTSLVISSVASIHRLTRKERDTLCVVLEKVLLDLEERLRHPPKATSRRSLAAAAPPKRARRSTQRKARAQGRDRKSGRRHYSYFRLLSAFDDRPQRRATA